MAAAELGVPLETAEHVVGQAERMGIDFEQYGTDRSNKQVLDDHNRSLRYVMQQLSSSNTVLHMSSSRDTKSAEDFPAPPPYGALMPISCGDLQLQTTHR